MVQAKGLPEYPSQRLFQPLVASLGKAGKLIRILELCDSYVDPKRKNIPPELAEVLKGSDIGLVSRLEAYLSRDHGEQGEKVSLSKKNRAKLREAVNILLMQIVRQGQGQVAEAHDHIMERWDLALAHQAQDE